MIEIKLIEENRRDFMELLLLGNEPESMVEKYLDISCMFALYEETLKGICLVTFPEEKVFEIKNIAVYPNDQRKGYGRILMEYAIHCFRYSANAMIVGTVENKAIISFYEACGFSYLHKLKNFLTVKYDHMILQNGKKMVDMVYFTKDIGHKNILNRNDIILRPADSKDQNEVERLTRDAFWNVYSPGCNEHYIVHIVSAQEFYVPDLHYVAEYQGRIIGDIIYCRNKLVDHSGNIHMVLGFGPLSVSPLYQRVGIGSMLVEHTIAIAKGYGYKAVLICGNPNFYSKFGFKASSEFGIYQPNGESDDSFLALELYSGALDGADGIYYDDGACGGIVSDDNVTEFDAFFEKRVKVKTPTQII